MKVLLTLRGRIVGVRSQEGWVIYLGHPFSSCTSICDPQRDTSRVFPPTENGAVPVLLLSPLPVPPERGEAS